MTNNLETLVIDNFRGSMTTFVNGDINSGLTSVYQAAGYDPFSAYGSLNWSAGATQIDPAGSVITDMILAGKERVESSITYVYAIGHTGRLYKIQVNDPTTFNPDYDNPVLLATLAIETPTFTRGAFIDFYGATEKIYISHDKGLTSINFDGTGEAFVGVVGSWTQNTPKPLQQFVGSLFIGNGENIAQVDSTATVVTYAKIEPAFPRGTQVRDIDLSTDGNYLEIVSSRLAQSDITTATQNTSVISNMESFLLRWNGVDVGITSQVRFPYVNMTSNITFGNQQYAFGYDLKGATFFDPINRITAGGQGAPFEYTPNPNAIMTDGQMVGFATTLPFDGHTELLYSVFGGYDWEFGTGYWSPFSMLATAPETDVLRVPYWQTVSNLGVGFSFNGYTSQIFGTSKVYFSTLEASSAPTTKYRFYKWSVTPTTNDSANTYNSYWTQKQLFSKKVQIKQVRIYGKPWQAGVQFSVDLIGSADTSIHSETITAGTNIAVGADYYWYTPVVAPTYALGLNIVNLGTTFNTINKVEVDYNIGGQ